jgi:hypothetical protein
MSPQRSNTSVLIMADFDIKELGRKCVFDVDDGHLKR